jgi:mono/diheme cytochrome c family protein
MKVKIIGGICLLLFALIYSCQSDESIEYSRYYSAGVLVYQSHCQNCHGDKGQGLNGLIPPLTDTLYIKSHKSTLACQLKNGLIGKIIISNATFDDKMPATDLSPIEMAQVITYVTNSFGNKQGIFTDDQVQTALNNCSK